MSVAEPVTWVDVESAVREWARDSVGSIDRRVFFGAKNTAARPQLVLFRVAGPDDACLIQFDVWGGTKAEAAAAAAELATAADALTRYRHAGVLLHDATVDSIHWEPDDTAATTPIPRYIVDVTFTATADS